MGARSFSIRSGQVKVEARSALHATSARWTIVTGSLTFDPDEPAREAAAELCVDMRALEAGDPLTTWKLRRDLDPERDPFAAFHLERIAEVRASGAGAFEAVALGQLTWRGHAVPLRATGRATLTGGTLRAAGAFELDVRKVGVRPPRLLMLKVEDVVRVEVTVEAVEAVAAER